jgi:membrane glycosyltransferase
MGIMCYLSAPIWFAFLVLSAGQLILGEERGGYGLLTSGLFNPGAAAGAMFALTLTLLFLPKVLSIAAVIMDGKARRSFGGGPALLASALLEQVFSTLQAPVLMAWYSRFVASTLAGRIVAWDAQPRGDRGVGLGEAFQCHAGHVILGLVMAAAALLVGPVLFWWMSPIILGLVLSPVLTSWSSRRSIGLLARRLRLFLIPAAPVPDPGGNRAGTGASRDGGTHGLNHRGRLNSASGAAAARPDSDDPAKSASAAAGSGHSRCRLKHPVSEYENFGRFP